MPCGRWLSRLEEAPGPSSWRPSPTVSGATPWRTLRRYRDKTADEPWKARDPIPTFRSYLLDSALATAGELDQIDAETEAEVEEAVQFAEASPEPTPDVMYDNVYA